MMKKKLRNYLLLLSFIEGAAVMCTELLGAKMVAPYFGTSLQSWAAVLGVTLMALTAGYYLGGRISEKKKELPTLFLVYMLAGFFLLLMPIISKSIMQITVDWPLFGGLIFSLIIFLLPPLFFMGMVSPLIIFHLTQSKSDSGRSAGLVYAISTCGGILATFLLGFIVIPEFGIKNPALIYGFAMMVFPAISLINRKLFKYAGLLMLPALILFFYQISRHVKLSDDKYKIRYHSEGLLGQIKVIDASEARGTGFLNYRFLLVNNTWQTTVVNEAPYFSLFEYVYYIHPIMKSFPKGSKALVFGMGGGSLVREFQKNGFDVKAVDIDKRLKNVAVKYFDFDPSTKVVIDDARHYLNNENEKYDVIVFDCFLAETPPGHLLTLEAFNKAKTLLKPNGALIVEFYGWLKGEDGKSSRSLYKTLVQAGFDCNMLSTRAEDGIENNFIFLATEKPFDFEKLNPVTFAYNEKVKQWNEIILDKNKIDIIDAIVFTDEYPVMEKMLMKPVMAWRKMLNERFAKEFLEGDLPLFF